MLTVSDKKCRKSLKKEKDEENNGWKIYLGVKKECKEVWKVGKRKGYWEKKKGELKNWP